MQQYFNPKLIPKMEWIISDNNPLIRDISDQFNIHDITDDDIMQIQKMTSYIDACYEEKEQLFDIVSGIGISGIQIGYKKRVCYIHYYDTELNKEIKILLANPQIIQLSSDISYLDTGEACLSVPRKIDGIVPRKFWIELTYYDLINKKNVNTKMSGFLAIVLQHEIDHMDGKLYYDHINMFYPNKIDKKWIKIE